MEAAALCRAWIREPCRARAGAQELAAVEALAMWPQWIPQEQHARRNRPFHRLGGGTLHTAAFRTPGNKQWPEPLDDLRNSLLTTFFRSCCGRSPLRRRLILIGPFL